MKNSDWISRFLMPFMPKPRANDDGGPRYADVYVRAVAACVDLSILFLILNSGFRLITSSMYEQIDHTLFDQAMHSTDLREIWYLLIQSNALHVMLVNGAIQIVIIGFVLVSVQWLWGTTPGKWLLDLRVRHAVTHEPPSRWQIVLRFFAYLPACAPLMLGVLWASFNNQRRGWHDYMARTVVVHQHPKHWHWEQFKRGVRWVRDYIVAKRQK